MSQLNEELCEWAERVSRKLPSLSRSQAWVLALYSFGMVLTHSCGVSTVSVFLGNAVGEKDNTVRQQLRKFTYDASDKRGNKRRAVEVEACFGDLVALGHSLVGR